MDYLQLSISLHDPALFEDIVISALADAGFDAFETTDGPLRAYIPKDLYDQDLIDGVLRELSNEIKSYRLLAIPHKNWNEEWEKSYQPVFVNKDLAIIAEFHEFPKGFKHVVKINPEMSFGTGHHATTQLMATAMMEMDMKGKQVFDFGSGTGILAILANKLGANHVYGVEIDEHATQNARSNLHLNNIPVGSVQIGSGGIELAAGQFFDIVLGNINRNVLCENMGTLAAMVVQGGYLVMSGFYEKDAPMVVDAALNNGFQIGSLDQLESWACLKMKKQ